LTGKKTKFSCVDFSDCSFSGIDRGFHQVGLGIEDDHTPFERAGVPSIDLIDWDFPCFHKTCDNLSAVSEKSLDASGEAVAGLLSTL